MLKLGMRSHYSSRPAKSPTLDGKVPVLPLRDTVHFPGVLNSVHVARERSLRTIRKALEVRSPILVLSQRDMNVEEPKASDLYRIGTLSEILHASPLADGSLRVVLRGLSRAEAVSFSKSGGLLWCEAEDPMESSPHIADELLSEVKEAFFNLLVNNPAIPAEANESISQLVAGGELADQIAHLLPVPPAEKQRVLECGNPLERLEQVFLLLRRELHVAERKREIRALADEKIAESHRQFVLRSQLAALQQELYGNAETGLQRVQRRIEEVEPPEQVCEQIITESKRAELLGPDSPESAVLEKHIECLLSIPWRKATSDQLDLSEAKRILDSAHAGLESIKDRVLEFMAVKKLTGSYSGNVLCFEGPPGVGKTSFARSVAQALGREFVNVSLGGVHDEAELRGHRKAYVGAGPGRIVRGLVSCGSNNPVFLLDELDKAGQSGNGSSNVLAALLEILDPTLNGTFTDHFVEHPVDLSKVLFITTANSCSELPPALRDRLEIVHFSSYTLGEKLEIARNHLVPQLCREHGLETSQLPLGKELLSRMVEHYTCEPGVRQLRRHISTVCRKIARTVVETGTSPRNLALDEYLGQAIYALAGKRTDAVGVASSLVVGANGGDAIQIEAAFLEPLSNLPEIRLTGNMGEVMKESAETAVSFLRSGAISGLQKSEFWRDVHIHASQAQLSKEGPSAGLAISVAVASAYLGLPVDSSVAITGEIGLRGKVLAVGGVREKVLAAHRLGFKTVVLPFDNEADLKSLPADVRSELSIKTVKLVDEALRICMPQNAAVLV